jgi:hypothetical protein
MGKGAAKMSFDDIKTMFDNRKNVIEREQTDLLALSEKGVELSFGLSAKIELHLYQNYLSSGKKLNGSSAVKPVLIRKAAQFLYSSLFLIRNGQIDPAYSCLRTVLEHIWKLYFLEVASDKEKKVLYKSEVGLLDKNEKKQVKNQFRYFSAAYLRKYLYSSNKSKMDKLYNGISVRPHPSITGARADIEFSKKPCEDVLRIIPLLSLSLLTVGFELYPNAFAEEDKVLLRDYGNDIGGKFGFLPNLIPDNEDLSNRLNIKHPQDI